MNPEDFLTNLSNATALAQSMNVKMMRAAEDSNGFHQYSIFLNSSEQPCVVYVCPSCEAIDYQNSFCMKCGLNII